MQIRVPLYNPATMLTVAVFEVLSTTVSTCTLLIPEAHWLHHPRP